MSIVIGDIVTLQITFEVDDDAIDPTTVSVLVTAPDESEATYTYAGGDITRDDLGEYSCDVTCTQSGRWVAVWTGTGDAADVQVVTWYVRLLRATLPDLEEVKDYLGEVNWTDTEVQGALDAETAAQRHRCAIPFDYPNDLAEALKRRVARNLAARSVPVATFTSFEGGGTSTRVPMHDPEIVRLEAPFRRRVVG